MISADKSWCLGILHAEMNKVFLKVLRPKKRFLPTSLHHQDPSQCEDTYSDEFNHTYSLTTTEHRCQHSTKVYWNASCNTCFILFPGTRFLFFHRICRATSSCPSLILLSLKRLSEPLKCSGSKHRRHLLSVSMCHFFKQMHPKQSSKSMPGEHREKHVVLKAWAEFRPIQILFWMVMDMGYG